MAEERQAVHFQVTVGAGLPTTLAEAANIGAVYVESQTEIAINGQGMPLDVFGKLVAAVAEVAGTGATFRNESPTDGLPPGVWNVITKGEYAESRAVDPAKLTQEALSELGSIETLERDEDGVTLTLKLPEPLADGLMQALEGPDGATA